MNRRRVDVLWVVPGLTVLVLLLLVVFHFYTRQDIDARISAKSRKIGLVAGMRLDLATASVAGKSAVMAIADRDSQMFADRARAATADLMQKHQELTQLLTNDGVPDEKKSLSDFGRAFDELRRIDQELLKLAVKNTNVKAFNLAFGPAAAAVNDMDEALSKVAAKGQGGREGRDLESLACGARIGAWRIEALLAPHIAEKSDRRMDELEAQMTQEDATVTKSLARLKRLAARSDLDFASASYARFSELRAQILRLSRENTNVRSLAMALDQDTEALLSCQEKLAALQRFIEDEPIPGVTFKDRVRHS